MRKQFLMEKKVTKKSFSVCCGMVSYISLTLFLAIIGNTLGMYMRNYPERILLFINPPTYISTIGEAVGLYDTNDNI